MNQQNQNRCKNDVNHNKQIQEDFFLVRDFCLRNFSEDFDGKDERIKISRALLNIEKTICPDEID